MRFCTHCGAQIPDNAKFCTACGTPTDAPDEATVVISDPEEPEEEVVDASDVEGEFTAASWSPEPAAKPAPAPKPAPKPQPAPQPRPQPRPAPQPTPQPQPQPTPQPAAAPKKKGFFSYLWLFLKVLIIAVAAVLLVSFLYGVYIGITS